MQVPLGGYMQRPWLEGICHTQDTEKKATAFDLQRGRRMSGSEGKVEEISSNQII